jgi:hypothetical protein
MNIPRHWWPLLSSPHVPKILLCTISPDGRDPIAERHLALESTSIRAATTTVHVVCAAADVTLPFWPTLLNWPAVDYQLSLEDKRLQISQFDVRLSKDSGLVELLLRLGGAVSATAQGTGTIGATARLELIAPGLDLSESLLLVAGPAHPTLDRRDGGVTLRVTDGDPDRAVTYPPDLISDAEFPGAPLRSRGRSAQVIVGGMPEAVVCEPIDELADGTSTRFLVSIPAMTALPTRIARNGTSIDGGLARARQSRTPSGRTYTELVLDVPASPDDEITASGGIGLSRDHPILFLLAQAGYSVSASARAVLNQLAAFDFSVLVNQSGAVLDILRKLVDQTTLVGGFRHGTYTVMDLARPGPTAALGIGTGLLYRLPNQSGLSTAVAVYNSFRVLCGRNHAASSSALPTPLLEIRRDPSHGPQAIRTLLAQSQALYGVRAMDPVPAYDLTVTVDADGTATDCPAGRALADLIASLYCRRRTRVAYKAAGWNRRVMALELGQRLEITDDNEGLNAAPARLTGWRLTATGPEIIATLFEEAA